MHILPPLETVKDIAATQQYDVLPLSCEILSDFITPIEAMRILKNVSTHCYMLESAQADDRWGRYTFLGFDPKLEITCIDGKMKAGGLTVRTDDPSQYLRELLPRPHGGHHSRHRIGPRRRLRAKARTHDGERSASCRHDLRPRRQGLRRHRPLQRGGSS